MCVYIYIYYICMFVSMWAGRTRGTVVRTRRRPSANEHTANTINYYGILLTTIKYY